VEKYFQDELPPERHCRKKFATCSVFAKVQVLFSTKRIHYFEKTPKLRVFWELPLFRSHSTSNLLPLTTLKKCNLFLLKKPVPFFKKPKI